MNVLSTGSGIQLSLRVVTCLMASAKVWLVIHGHQKEEFGYHINVSLRDINRARGLTYVINAFPMAKIKVIVPYYAFDILSRN